MTRKYTEKADKTNETTGDKNAQSKVMNDYHREWIIDKTLIKLGTQLISKRNFQKN